MPRGSLNCVSAAMFIHWTHPIPLQPQQLMANPVQIGQRAGHEQPIGIFLEPTVAHFSETEDTLDDQKRMFDVGAHLRLRGVLRLLGRSDLSHNHPSGVAEPSHADETLTQALRQALALVDIRVLDHFTVAGSAVQSFAERGQERLLEPGQ